MALANWCVDKYKSEFESEDHWLLRKKFMETHKDKFPENKLVCLSRVFFNVEFLGCKYPNKTMQLVAELSKGVADDHREKQKGRLKRTFVQASDAAGAKIKGTPSKAELPSKMRKTPPGKHGLSYNSLANHAQTIADTGDFPGFIIFVNCNSLNQVESCPVNILMQSAAKSRRWKKIAFNFPIEKITEDGDRICEISINNKFLSSGEGKTNREAKVAAAEEGLKILRKTCYTIQAKCAFYSETPLVSKSGQSIDTDKPLPQDNIGTRMMLKMGWTGSGLGRNQQGIQEPVKATSQIIKREGLGSMNKNQMHGRFRKVLKDYIASGSDCDLVFTSDFSKDERKTLHKLALSLSLKTKSYGKDEDRHLVVFKFADLRSILESLLVQGGETEKYTLSPPTGADETYQKLHMLTL